MNVRVRAGWAAAALAIFGAAAVRGDEPGWTSLFDGKTLNGWSVRCVKADEAKTFWSVEEGAIVCNSMNDGDHHYVWLVADKECQRAAGSALKNKDCGR